MAYVAPSTKSTGEVVTAAGWNQDIVANILALKDPPSEDYILDEATNYTTTSTSLTDVDPGSGPNTKLRLDVTTTGGDLLVHFHGSLAGSAAILVYFDVSLDGAAVGGDDGFVVAGLHAAATSVPGVKAVNFTRLLTGVSAAAHILKLQWQVNSGTATLYAGAGTADYDVHPQFWAREMS